MLWCECCVISVVSILCVSLLVLLWGSVLISSSGCGRNVVLMWLCRVCSMFVVFRFGVMISVIRCVIVVLLCVCGVVDVLFGM